MSGIIITETDPIRLNEEGVVDTLIPASEDDKRLQDRCLSVLWLHYPGAPWRVDVNSTRGVCDIFNLALSSRYGVRWKLGRLYADPDLYWVKMAGGELLERARVARGRFDEDETLVEWIEGIPKKDQPVNGLAI